MDPSDLQTSANQALHSESRVPEEANVPGPVSTGRRNDRRRRSHVPWSAVTWRIEMRCREFIAGLGGAAGRRRQANARRILSKHLSAIRIR